MLCWKNSNIQSLVFRMSFVEPEFITFKYFQQIFQTTKIHQVFWWPKYLLKSLGYPFWDPGKIRGSPAVLCRDGARSLGGLKSRRRWNETGDESVTEFPYVSWLRSDITVTERNLKKCVFFFGSASFISWNVRLNKMMKKTLSLPFSKQTVCDCDWENMLSCLKMHWHLSGW